MAVNLLVTGSAGFVGSNFVRYWVDDHPRDRVVGLDLLTYAGNRSSLADLEGRYAFVRGDIGDLELVESTLREHSVDVIVNFAAESHNSLAVVDPGRFFRTNVLGTQALCEAARRVGVGRLHHISTCEVYGDLPLDSEAAFREDDPYRPRTPYNASKAGADHAVRAYHETYELPVTITNAGNNYGPYQFPEKLIPLFIKNLLADQPVPVYGDGQQVRDWLHVSDHCSAIDAVLQRGRPGQVYNVGGRCERTNLHLTHELLRLLGKPHSLIRHVADRPGHDLRYAIDFSKARRELGWQPEIAFEDGLAETIEWYSQHTDWVENIRSGEYRSYYEEQYGRRLGGDA